VTNGLRLHSFILLDFWSTQTRRCIHRIQPPGEVTLAGVQLFLALRPDRPPAPECERVHMRARLANGAIVPGWPLPRNDSTDAA
jgi:hypothetical protein